MLTRKQIESIYEKIKLERERLSKVKKNAEDLKKEKGVIEEIEKLDIEITLLESILEI
jgi:hypothetical protein